LETIVSTRTYKAGWRGIVTGLGIVALQFLSMIHFDQTMLRDVGEFVNRMSAAGVNANEVEALRTVLLQISRHVASYGWLAFFLAFMGGVSFASIARASDSTGDGA